MTNTTATCFRKTKFILIEYCKIDKSSDRSTSECKNLLNETSEFLMHCLKNFVDHRGDQHVNRPKMAYKAD